MASPALEGDAIAVSKFYGQSLPRPTIIGDREAPAAEVADRQNARAGFVPATQPLMGAVLDPQPNAVSTGRLSSLCAIQLIGTDLALPLPQSGARRPRYGGVARLRNGSASRRSGS